MARVTKYNAKDCTITVGNVYITGLGESMIEGSKDEDFFSTSVGAQGDVVVNEINDDLGTIELTVQSTSPQKQYLINLGKNRKEVAIWVVNKTLKERFGGTKARIVKYPDISEGKEAGERTFTFKVFDYVCENA